MNFKHAFFRVFAFSIFVIAGSSAAQTVSESVCAPLCKRVFAGETLTSEDKSRFDACAAALMCAPGGIIPPPLANQPPINLDPMMQLRNMLNGSNSSGRV